MGMGTGVCVCKFNYILSKECKMKNRADISKKFRRRWKKALSKIHVPNSWLQGCRVQILGAHRNQGNQI